jgi:hypothetical protein
LAGLGIPQEHICLLLINPQTGKPLDEKSLRKHFKREIATGEIELHARIGNFMVTTILGMAPPAGTVGIDNQHARASLLSSFVKIRMNWKEPVVNRHKEHADAPIEDQDTNVRQKIFDDIQRLFRCHRLPLETEGESYWRQAAGPGGRYFTEQRFECVSIDFFQRGKRSCARACFVTCSDRWRTTVSWRKQSLH